MNLDVFRDNIQRHVVIYTDGACSGNPGPGGWAALLAHKHTVRYISGFSPETTNNQMELLAAIMALRKLKTFTKAEVHADSQYVVKGMNEWVLGWERKRWREGTPNAVKNPELWRDLLEESRKHDLVWTWVRGHSSDPINNFVDRLAVSAIKHRCGVDKKIPLIEFEHQLLYEPILPTGGTSRGDQFNKRPDQLASIGGAERNQGTDSSPVPPPKIKVPRKRKQKAVK